MRKFDSVRNQGKNQAHLNLHPVWLIKALLNLKTVDLCLNIQFFNK